MQVWRAARERSARADGRIGSGYDDPTNPADSSESRGSKVADITQEILDRRGFDPESPFHFTTWNYMPPFRVSPSTV